MGKIPFIIVLFLAALTIDVPAQKSAGVKTCMDCHGKVVEKKVPHKPVTEGCGKCHTSNGKKHPLEDVAGFTLTLKVPQLCFSCHENKYQDAHVHRPVTDGDCGACHDAHSSNEKHLTSILPPKQCYFCHTDLKDSVAKASLVHGAMNDSLTCLRCHNPHATPEKKLLISEEKTLCFSCHNKPIKKDKRTIQNMKHFIETSKYVHGTIDNNGCAVCHNPHASDNGNLLRASFPSSNYAPGKKENYNQCFPSCHESTMIEDSVSRETGFRNGSKNLHYLHVVKEKGRSCTNCHNVHASNNLYLLEDKVKFGEWDMPLLFKRIDKGGSCTPGCHREKSYQR